MLVCFLIEGLFLEGHCLIQSFSILREELCHCQEEHREIFEEFLAGFSAWLSRRHIITGAEDSIRVSKYLLLHITHILLHYSFAVCMSRVCKYHLTQFSYAWLHELEKGCEVRRTSNWPTHTHTHTWLLEWIELSASVEKLATTCAKVSGILVQSCTLSCIWEEFYWICKRLFDPFWLVRWHLQLQLQTARGWQHVYLWSESSRQSPKGAMRITRYYTCIT